MNKTKIKVGILATSLPQMSIIALVGVVPMAINYYSHVSPTVVQTAFTIPMLACALTSLTVGRLAAKTGKKPLLVAGVAMILIFGVMPALFNFSLPLFMVMTAGIGMGVGCTSPLSTALVPEYFEGHERHSLMGIQSAFVNIGGMTLTFVAGFLLRTGWRNAFFMYLLMIPLLIASLICLPSGKLAPAPGGPESGGKAKLGNNILSLYAVFVIYGIMFSVINTNAGLLVLERGLGDPAVASFASSISATTGIVMGIAYGLVHKTFKRFALPMALATFALGMFTMANAPSLPFFYIGSFFIGTSVPTAIPTGFSIVTKLTAPYSPMFAISGLLATWFTALFISPIVINPISYAIADGTARSRYMIGFAVIFALCAIAFYAQKKNAWEPKAEVL